jgi:hypothetical protein
MSRFLRSELTIAGGMPTDRPTHVEMTEFIRENTMHFDRCGSPIVRIPKHDRMRNTTRSDLGQGRSALNGNPGLCGANPVILRGLTLVMTILGMALAVGEARNSLKTGDRSA